MLLITRISRLLASWKTAAILSLLILESLYHARASHPKLATPLDGPFASSCPGINDSAELANATLLMLARNSDLEGAKTALTSIHERFNSRYPLVVLNNENFTIEFETAIRSIHNNVTFSVIPKDMWGYPSNLDLPAAQEAMKKQEQDGILYGAIPNYHKMCRFNSGFFFDLEVLRQYRWYWRIEPDIEFTCDIPYDPFIEMQRQNKRYGYVIALWEIYKTIPSLFQKVSAYKKARNIKTSRLWSALVNRSRAPWPFRWLMTSDGDSWNLCHFWSNFEIADMDWYRSDEYRNFFKYLDDDGGFFLERWGDAPVHTFAAALLLQDTFIHHFQDWGYVHPPFQYIPTTPIDGSSPMNNLQSQSIEEWSQHSKVIGCNCKVDMNRAGVVRPNCMNTIKKAYS